MSMIRLRFSLSGDSLLVLSEDFKVINSALTMINAKSQTEEVAKINQKLKNCQRCCPIPETLHSIEKNLNTFPTPEDQASREATTWHQ